METEKLSILLIEDLQIAQKAALDLFKQLNCWVRVADTGSEAFEEIFKHKYDIIFIDIQLPDFSGFEVAETMRAMQHRTRTPLIAVTANSSPDLETQAKIAGFDDYLLKPLSQESVRHMLFKHLHSKCAAIL